MYCVQKNCECSVSKSTWHNFQMKLFGNIGTNVVHIHRTRTFVATSALGIHVIIYENILVL